MATIDPSRSLALFDDENCVGVSWKAGMSKGNVIVGLIVAPLVSSILFWIAFSLYDGSAAVFWLLPVLATAYACSFVFGAPAHLALRHFGLDQWWSYALTGAIIGLIPAVSVWMLASSTELIVPILAGFGLFLGPLAAIVFWLIVVRQQPVFTSA